MKKALPILWRYLGVVALSCLLSALFANLAQAQSSGAADQPKVPVKSGVSATDKIAVSEETWKDAKRERDVPVRIVAPAKPSAALPVILFSHGLGGSRMGGTLWAEHWAGDGFIVVQMQHPGSDESLWKGHSPRELASRMRAGMTMSNLSLRVQDVHFVIDTIIARAKAKEGVFAFTDPERIGMSGHSFGAQTTLAVSGQVSPLVAGQSGLDTRIKAAVAFSPNARNKRSLERQFGDIRIPFFSITGTEDGSVLDDGTKPEDRQLPYAHMPSPSKYLLVFEGGDHNIFGGHQLRGTRRDAKRDAAIQERVKIATTAFWRAMLKDDAEARKSLEGGFKSSLNANDKFEFK